MAQSNWSVQDAKKRFGEIVEAARRMPQTVTKHGKPAVVVMDVVEYERLRHLERALAPSFADVLLTNAAGQRGISAPPCPDGRSRSLNF